MPPDAALETVRLSKRYRRGGALALDDVSLAVRSGTITALVGPNGAGKSTLIRSFIGFERPTAGDLRVCGIDVRRDRVGVIDRTGYVPQASSLYRGLSVDDHLELAASLRSGFDRDVAVLRLGRFGIGLDRRVGELSGGQQAQVMLSIALGTRAPVLLLDEPLSSLDPLARHDFLSTLVADVRERGATVLMSSHIVSDVESACDSLIVLAGGRVALHDTTEAALAGHRLVDGGATGHPGEVAAFARPGGEPVRLVRSADASLPRPTLEELVMGYLASGATQPSRPDEP